MFTCVTSACSLTIIETLFRWHSGAVGLFADVQRSLEETAQGTAAPELLGGSVRLVPVCPCLEGLQIPSANEGLFVKWLFFQTRNV